MNNHGGKREGSGRKDKGRSAFLYVKVLPEVKLAIYEEAKKQNLSVPDLIEKPFKK